MFPERKTKMAEGLEDPVQKYNGHLYPLGKWVTTSWLVQSVCWELERHTSHSASFSQKYCLEVWPSSCARERLRLPLTLSVSTLISFSLYRVPRPVVCPGPGRRRSYCWIS